MPGDEIVQRRSTGRRFGPAVSWWPAVRLALLVLWAALSWWSAPRERDAAQARADLAAGRVVSYEWGDSWSDGGPASAPRLRSSAQYGPIFAWRTTTWRVHYTVLHGEPDPSTLTQQVREADPAAAGGGLYPRTPPIGLVGALLVGSILGSLIYGPAPVTGTRWFWFWLMGGVPFGLGMLYWLLKERPWAAEARQRVGPDGSDARRRWYVGLGLGILTTLIGSLLVFLLNRLLGDNLVPRVTS